MLPFQAQGQDLDHLLVLPLQLHHQQPSIHFSPEHFQVQLSKLLHTHLLPQLSTVNSSFIQGYLSLQDHAVRRLCGRNPYSIQDLIRLFYLRL